jgi:alpha-tubulin suppressor-like RCC1 family protein
MNNLRMTLFSTLMLLSLPQLLEADLSSIQPGWVIGWGSNGAGQATGVPTRFSSNVPGVLSTGTVMVADCILSNAVAIMAGQDHSLALRRDGTVVGWGRNIWGAVTEPKLTSMPGVTNGIVRIGDRVLSNATAIAVGRTYSVALKSNGTITSWGDDHKIKMPELTNITAIAAGWTHVLALKNNGTVVDSGLAGIPHCVSNVVAIATGTTGFNPLNLALRQDGTVIEWGREPNDVETLIPAGCSNIIAIATSGGHCLTLRQDGTIFGWGDNNVGQATGTANTNAPYYSEGVVTIGGNVLSNVVAIAAGSQYSLALTSSGMIVAWGGDHWHPKNPPCGLTNVVAIAAGDDFCLAITTNSAVAARFRQNE